MDIGAPPLGGTFVTVPSEYVFEFHSDDPTSSSEFFEYVNPGILFKPPMSVAKANAVLPWAHRFMMSDLVALCGEAYAAHISDLAEMNSVSDKTLALDLTCEYMHLGRKAMSVEQTLGRSLTCWSFCRTTIDLMPLMMTQRSQLRWGKRRISSTH